MSNVLMNSTSVVEKVKQIFPEAQIENQVTDRGFELKCTLLAGGRSFRVHKILDANQFDSALKRLFDQLVFCQTVHRPQPECYVNIKLYSLLPELSRPECKVYLFSSELAEEEINPSRNRLKNLIIHQNASKGLELSQENGDSVILNERYEYLCEAWSERMLEAKKLKSECLAQEFEKRLRRVQIADETLTQ